METRVRYREAKNRPRGKTFGSTRMIKVTSGGASYVVDAEQFANLQGVRDSIEEATKRFPELDGPESELSVEEEPLRASGG